MSDKPAEQKTIGLSQDVENKPLFEVDTGSLDDAQLADAATALRDLHSFPRALVEDQDVFIPMPTPQKPPPMFGTGENGVAKGEPLPPPDYTTQELTLEEQRLLASHRLRKGAAHWENLTPEQRERAEKKWGHFLEGVEVSASRRHQLLALFDLELLAPMPSTDGES